MDAEDEDYYNFYLLECTLYLQTNSYQMVLVTDGEYSFTIFNYGDLGWSLPAEPANETFTGMYHPERSAQHLP